MALLRVALLAAVITPSLALAQPAPAPSPPKSRESIENFVSAFATPTQTTGKLARWETGICPIMTGQKANVAAFVTQHLLAIAGAVGAPVSTQKDCTANIEIVFTTAPQALMDSVREHNTDYIGYAPGDAELRKAATVTHPVQAWYSTETLDLRGRGHIDTGRDRGASEQVSSTRVTGTHLADGVRSAFHHILIVVDPSKLAGQEILPLSDYIAMLALAQPGALDGCQVLPSIVNLLAAGCAPKPDHITEGDLAYLRGLYAMNADRQLLASQKTDIADQMAKVLGAQ
jgi:hypothetical protein